MAVDLHKAPEPGDRKSLGEILILCCFLILTGSFIVSQIVWLFSDHQAQQPATQTVPATEVPVNRDDLVTWININQDSAHIGAVINQDHIRDDLTVIHGTIDRAYEETRVYGKWGQYASHRLFFTIKEKPGVNFVTPATDDLRAPYRMGIAHFAAGETRPGDQVTLYYLDQPKAMGAEQDHLYFVLTLDNETLGVTGYGPDELRQVSKAKR